MEGLLVVFTFPQREILILLLLKTISLNYRIVSKEKKYISNILGGSTFLETFYSPINYVIGTIRINPGMDI